MLGKDTIIAVQERAEIEEVVSDYVSLKKKGQNLWACCPFHDEKSPSFSVAPNKGIYKCFGCGKAGDSIQFVMDIEGVGFTEAVKQLAGKYGIEIEEKERSYEEEQVHNEKEGLYILLNYAKEYYEKQLWENNEGKAIGLSYFKERGLTESIIRKFELGYSTDKWDGLMKEALKDHFTEDQLEKAGLIVKNEQKTYDRFRGRVMFPIHNVSGKAIAFGARILTNLKNQPKYINSPETAVYHKSDVLYGISQAKKAIRNEDNCYLVEGYTDVISMHLAGVENVVASSGTSLTENQVKLIGRFTQNITVLFDGDSAGLKAAIRGIDIILESGLNVKVVIFPDGEDPDSFAQKSSTEAFKAYLAEAVDFIVFKTRLLIGDTHLDPVKKAETIKDVVNSIAKIPDPLKRNIYLQECSEMLKMDEAVLITELNKHILQERRKKKEINKTETEDLLSIATEKREREAQYSINDSLALQERESIRLLLNYGNLPIAEDALLVEYLYRELDGIDFSHPLYHKLWEEIRNGLEEGVWKDIRYFSQQPDEELRKLVFELSTERYELSANWEIKYQIYTLHEKEVLNDSAFTNILRLKHRAILRHIDRLREEMKQHSNEADVMQWLQKIKDLNDAKKEVGELLGMVVVR